MKIPQIIVIAVCTALAGCDKKPARAAEEPKPEVSLTSIVRELNLEHPKEERKKIFESPSKVTLFQLRGKYDLWNDKEKSAVRIYFEKHGIKHPDWISDCILQAWSNSNSSEGLNEDKVLREFAEKQKQWSEWTEDLRLHPEKYASQDDALDPFAPHAPDNRSEQAGADQPATAPESKPEGDTKPDPESEERPQ